MEPIRSEANRGLDRKRKRTNSQKTTGEGDFFARLDGGPPDSSETESESVFVDLSGIVDITAPAERLYDAVHEAGQRLLQERTYTAAQRYRETVRRFLKRVVPEANSVVTHESNRDILSRKRYYLLTTVNRSVDRLITGLLQAQTEQLDILKRLEEIEGLLVDLMQ